MRITSPFSKVDLERLGFRPMENHNPRYWISMTGKVYDTEEKEFLSPRRYSGQVYPSVRLKLRRSHRILEMPRLVYLYFVDPKLASNSRIELDDPSDSFNFSKDNLRVVDLAEYRHGGSRASSAAFGNEDNSFVNWNDTALYC